MKKVKEIREIIGVPVGSPHETCGYATGKNGVSKEGLERGESKIKPTRARAKAALRPEARV